MTTLRIDNKPAANSTYPKGGVSCSKDSFVGKSNISFSNQVLWQKSRPSGSCKPSGCEKTLVFFYAEQLKHF
jgi:hypothetical protein